MDQLLIMLKSGVSIQQAVDIMVITQPQQTSWKTIQAELREGQPIPKAMQYLFPWWCQYPFSNVTISIDTISFLESCEEYLTYRLMWFKHALNVLAYPLFLYFFSVVLIGSFFKIGLFHGAVPREITFSLIGVFISITTFIFYLVLGIFRISSFDVLNLCRLCFNQGWSYHTMFTSLSFSGKLQFSWKKMITNVLFVQSFIQGFSNIFMLPKSIEISLKTHEMNGQLNKGLALVLPHYRALLFQRFGLKCYFLKFILYIFVVSIIFLMLYLVYIPMMQSFTL